MTDEFEGIDEKPKIKDLSLLHDKVETLRNCQAKLKANEKEGKVLAKRIQELESKEVPDMMDNFEISELKLKDGKHLKVKPIIKATLPTKGAIQKQKDEIKKAELENRLSEGLQWLRENGAESLIKNMMAIEFSKGQDNLVGDFLGKAEELGLPALREEGIHNSTLTKFVKEKMEANEEVPTDLLGVYCGRKAEVK